MQHYGYIGRKMRLPRLKEKPAVVIAAFGTSSRGRAAVDLFQQKLEQSFPDYEYFWAYTSEIIRKKFDLPGLQETLAKVEASGYRKAVVQPLHIFPGTEYQQLIETSYYFPGLRTIVSETLCHRWDFVREVLDVMEVEFLPDEEGLNLLALHGTPLTADPVNTVYLGLERIVADLYTNVMVASIEGVPDHGAVLRRIERQEGPVSKHKRIRIIPMMYYAGMHVEEDLMAEEDSWREHLEKFGFSVECPTITHDHQEYFKGLAFYPKCLDFILERLERSLELARYY